VRTIIAGSRGITKYKFLRLAIEHCPWTPTIVLSGTCPDSPDVLGERWANLHNIPVERYPANWDQFGKRAGMLRNSLMAYKGQALIALWDGVSTGTAHMIEAAKTRRLRIFVVNFKNKTRQELK
jgi:hypothetical protein